MKKSALFLILLFGVSASAISFAEEPEDQAPARPWERPSGQQSMSGDKKMDKMGKMDGMMMKGMHQQPTVVATSDGGVVVLAGGKLTKYDASLNLVKEVEMKMDKGKGPKAMGDRDPMGMMDAPEMQEQAPPPPAPAAEPVIPVAEPVAADAPSAPPADAPAETAPDTVWHEAGQSGQ